MTSNLTSFFVALVLGASSLACQKETGEPAKEAAAPQAEAAAAPKTTGHAPSGVKPGSHEDWCEEHQVPESMCTRCNPTLVAAFKATGDWCPEHGLPESQCTLCNPGLKIERPPKQEGH